MGVDNDTFCDEACSRFPACVVAILFAFVVFICSCALLEDAIVGGVVSVAAVAVVTTAVVVSAIDADFTLVLEIEIHRKDDDTLENKKTQTSWNMERRDYNTRFCLFPSHLAPRIK